MAVKNLTKLVLREMWKHCIFDLEKPLAAFFILIGHSNSNQADSSKRVR